MRPRLYTSNYSIQQFMAGAAASFGLTKILLINYILPLCYNENVKHRGFL